MPDEQIIIETDDGRRVAFPAHFTDEQIDAALAGLPGRDEDTPSGPEPLISEDSRNRFRAGALDALNPLPMLRRIGEASQDPRGPQMGAGQLVADVAGGIGRSHLETGRKAYDAFRQGRYSEAAGYGGATLLPVVGPMAARIGERIGSGDVAGGLGEAVGSVGGMMAAGPAARAVRGVANVGARSVLDTADPRVADAALRHRALPGLFRTGEARTGTRLTRAERGARSAVESSPAASQPIGRVRHAAGDEAWKDITKVYGADKSGPRAVAADFRSSVLPKNQTSTREVATRAEATRRSAQGDRTTTGQMARAVSRDARAAVGSRVPAAARDLRAIDDLDEVALAYANRNGGNVINQGGIPTIQARIAASVLDRLFAPTVQGAYNVSRGMAPAVRAAIIHNLLPDGLDPMSPMASH